MTDHRPDPNVQKPVPVTADVFAAGDPHVRILLAGLLADKPDLVGAELLPAKWQKALDEYAASPRP